MDLDPGLGEASEVPQKDGHSARVSKHAAFIHTCLIIRAIGLVDCSGSLVEVDFFLLIPQHACWTGIFQTTLATFSFYAGPAFLGHICDLPGSSRILQGPGQGAPQERRLPRAAPDRRMAEALGLKPGIVAKSAAAAGTISHQKKLSAFTEKRRALDVSIDAVVRTLFLNKLHSDEGSFRWTTLMMYRSHT